MPTARENEFTGYDFTEEELLVASVFPEINRQYLQNELAVAAEKKVLIEYDDTRPQLAMLQTAYYNGQLDILKFILGINKDRADDLREYLEEAKERQQRESSVPSKPAASST